MSDNDLKLLISAFIHEYGLVDHITKSVNDAYLNGIPTIMKHQYEVDELYKNKTMKGTKEWNMADKEVDYSRFKMICTESVIEKPVTLKDGKSSPIYPNECIKDGTLYGGNLKASYKIQLSGYDKDDNMVKNQEATIKHAIFGKMPIFLMSNLCNLEHLSKQELFEIGENPLEKGGYVRRGKTSTTFDMNERTNIYNKPNIYYVKGDNVEKSLKSLISRCNIISKPGIDYENSSEFHVYYRDTGEITLKITNGSHLNEIPFYVLFRLWGVSSDIDILKYSILSNEIDGDEYFTTIFIRALSSVTPNYEHFIHDIDINSILDKLTKFIGSNTLKRNVYREKILGLFDVQILPHLGIEPKHRHFKLIYIGILIRKCLLVAKNRKLATDRDSLSEKYIATAGNLMADQFKTLYNKKFIQIVKNKISTLLTTNPLESIDIESIVRSIINNSSMCGKISASINSDTGIGPGIKRKFTTQNLPPEGELSELNKKNVIRINVEPKSKNYKIRMTHATYTGGIDQAASPEGADVGLNKTKTVVSLISPKGDYSIIEELIIDKDITKLTEELPISEMENRATVSVNGKLIGFCDNIIKLREKYVQLRRNEKISMYTGIHINTIFDELDFRSDDGRILSVYIIVYNNIRNPELFKKKYSKGANFEQKTLFNLEIADKVKKKLLTLNDLRKMKIIEFLDIKELTHSVFCARSMAYLNETKNDPLYQFTHVIIQAAMYGILCITQPMADHNPEIRTNFQSKLSKQTTTIPVYNKNPFLNMWVQAKNDIPITKTIVDDFLPPGGRNIILAVLSLAHNQEDSIIGNKGTFDRGNYLIDYYDIISCQVESGEKVESIYKDLTINIKSGDTSKLVDGVIAKGSRIYPKDIILSKYAEVPKSFNSTKKFIDKSVIYSGSYPATVIDIIPPSKNEEGSIFKIKIQYERVPRSGDKFSSRQGQKGILAKIYPNHLMPFAKDGLTPDFIFNPQGLPKRCTIGQCLEGLVSILNSHMGIITDHTPFTDLDVHHILDCLDKRNYTSDKQTLYSGFESIRMDADIVVVPCRYGRINKSVYDKHRSVFNACKDIETRQPKKGKKRGGGIKMGEMEGQGIAVSGPSTAMKEYYTKNSDGMIIYGCRCGSPITIVNEKNNIYECLNCDEPSIVKTYSSFTSNMTRNVMEGMRVHTTYVYD